MIVGWTYGPEGDPTFLFGSRRQRQLRLAPGLRAHISGTRHPTVGHLGSGSNPAVVSGQCSRTITDSCGTAPNSLVPSGHQSRLYAATSTS